MSYFEELKSLAEGSAKLHISESRSGDVSIRYFNELGSVLFSVSILPEGVRASHFDNNFEKARYRSLSQGKIGDKLWRKVKELAPDPGDKEKLLKTIELVGDEHS